MFSYEERKRAVELYLKYDRSASSVIHELGYPSYKSLRDWVDEYEQGGKLHQKVKREPAFSVEQQKKAIAHFFENGRCISRTVRVLGYPSRPTLSRWIDEIDSDSRKHHIKNSSLVKFTQEQKAQAITELRSGGSSVRDVAAKHGVTPATLYGWEKKMRHEESVLRMKEIKTNDENISKDSQKEIDELITEKEELAQQLATLKKEVFRLQIEKDILEKAAEIIKKDQGISLKSLTNREKAIVVGALRGKYRLKDLLEAFAMAKSSYCYQENALRSPDKYADLRTGIKNIFKESFDCYGYRRIHASIRTQGAVISEKIIRRIMKEEQLIVPGRKKRKYSSYKGEISPEVENIIQRDFHADMPNKKWLTDLTEFAIPAGKIYLSPIIDCFDGMAVSWTIGTSPDADLVNSMLNVAISTLKEGEKPILHSDRGCHYRWPGWIERMDKANLTRSMSKKGCSPDNSACEGFFGRLKNEMFYGRSWAGVTIRQFIQKVDSYIKWYNEKRIKLSLGALSPLVYRKSLGFAG